MTIETLRNALLWCGIINYGMLVLWALLVLLVPWVTRWHAGWFRLSVEQLNAMQYSLIVLYKLLIFLFFLVPYVVLRFLV